MLDGHVAGLKLRNRSFAVAALYSVTARLSTRLMRET
jgi:hypothetical protein